MFSSTSQDRSAAGPLSRSLAVGALAALLFASLSLRVAESVAQPVPVFEASGYGAVRPWYESGPAHWPYDHTLQLVSRPADALAPAMVVTLPGWSTMARAELWRISPDGVPWFEGYLPLRARAMTAAWIDVDGDGHSDLVCGESWSTGPGLGVEIFRMTASGLETPGRFVGGLRGTLGEIRTLLAADVNADGRTDIGLGHIEPSSRSEANTWLVASGPDSFVEVISPDFRDGAWSAQLEMDGDSHADIVSFDRDSQKLLFRHGFGDGTFAHDDMVWHPADGPPLVSDLDGDGLPDVLAGRYLYLGAEAGEPVLADTLDQIAQSVTDFDHDGLADLVSIGAGIVRVAKGIGGASFTPFVAADLGGFEPGYINQASPVTVIDVNADGWADLVGTALSGRTLQVVKGKAPGTFFKPLVLATGASPVQVALADVVGNDGELDVVVLARGARRLELKRGIGDGRFGPSESFDVPPGARRFALGDIDEDGRLDAAIACDSSRTMAILWGDAAGFGARSDFAAPDSLLEIAVADIDEDGHLDVLASSSTLHPQAWSGGASRALSAMPVSFQGGVQGRFLLRDFDEDGHLDLLCPRQEYSGYRALTGDGLGYWQETLLSRGGGRPNELASPFAYGQLAEFERPFFVYVSSMDSAGARYSWLGGEDYSRDGLTWQHRLGRAPGSDWPGAPPVHELPPSPVQVELADVSGDGHADVVALFRDPALLTVLPGLPGALFGEPVSHIVGLRPSSFALGDVDGNGLPDAVVANQGANNVIVLRHRAGQVSGVPPASVNGGLELRALGAIGAARPRLQLTLASGEPAVLELFDTQGRRLTTLRIDSPAPGARVVGLDESRLPAAGLVFARLRQGPSSATARFVRLP